MIVRLRLKRVHDALKKVKSKTVKSSPVNIPLGRGLAGKGQDIWSGVPIGPNY